MNLSKGINYIKLLLHRKSELDRYLELIKKANEYCSWNSIVIHRQSRNMYDDSMKYQYNQDHGIGSPIVFLARGSSMEN